MQPKKVNWALAADIRGFFDAIDHQGLQAVTPMPPGNPAQHAFSSVFAGLHLRFRFDFPDSLSQNPDFSC
jgi:hypothetical protein